MDILTVDFETYYDTDYSLRKMTMIEYIMDARFQPIMMSYAINDEPVKTAVGYPAIKKVLDSIDWNNTILNAQNTMFDGTIIHQRFKHKARYYTDTMAMARVTGAHVVAGGASLEKIGNLLISLGYPIPPKGDAVKSASGLHLYEVYDPDKAYLAECPITDKNSVEMQQARQLLGKYIEYCENDVELARQAFKYFSTLISPEEMQFGDMILKCYIEPQFLLDLETIQDEIGRIEQRDIDFISELALRHFGGDIRKLSATCRSAPKFTAFLESLGGVVDPKKPHRFVIPTKYSEKKGKIEPCYSKAYSGMMEMLEHEDPDIADLFKLKLLMTSSIEMSRAKRFESIAKLGVGFGMPYSVSGAHTHRLGGCVVADTKVIVLTTDGCIIEKRIIDVLLSDLVWDGEEFCEHEGVVFQGYQEVITYDGITGTKNHPCFINENETRGLAELAESGERIMDCPTPQDWGINPDHC